MEQNDHSKKGYGHGGPDPDRPDRQDNDSGLDKPAMGAGHDEYEARLERKRKDAAWRTEMAQRLRRPGHRPPRPDNAF